MEDTRDRQQNPEQDEERKEPRSGLPLGKIAGGVCAFLALALYIVWIGSEMGSHAASGTFEMWAIFGAIFIGVVALLAGGASMRRH